MLEGASEGAAVSDEWFGSVWQINFSQRMKKLNVFVGGPRYEAVEKISFFALEGESESQEQMLPPFNFWKCASLFF